MEETNDDLKQNYQHNLVSSCPTKDLASLQVSIFQLAPYSKNSKTKTLDTKVANYAYAWPNW